LCIREREGEREGVGERLLVSVRGGDIVCVFVCEREREGGETGRQADRQTGRQTNIKTDRQSDRRTDRQKDMTYA
jgi:hypothetical protein